MCVYSQRDVLFKLQQKSTGPNTLLAQFVAWKTALASILITVETVLKKLYLDKVIAKINSCWSIAYLH